MIQSEKKGYTIIWENYMYYVVYKVINYCLIMFLLEVIYQLCEEGIL